MTVYPTHVSHNPPPTALHLPLTPHTERYSYQRQQFWQQTKLCSRNSRHTWDHYNGNASLICGMIATLAQEPSGNGRSATCKWWSKGYPHHSSSCVLAWRATWQAECTPNRWPVSAILTNSYDVPYNYAWDLNAVALVAGGHTLETFTSVQDVREHPVPLSGKKASSRGRKTLLCMHESGERASSASVLWHIVAVRQIRTCRQLPPDFAFDATQNPLQKPQHPLIGLWPSKVGSQTSMQLDHGQMKVIESIRPLFCRVIWYAHASGNLECSSFLASSGRDVFVCPNVTLRPLWPFYSTLVGADPVDKTGGKRDLVESWTPWCQCVGSGRATVVLQPHRDSKQFGKLIHWQDLIGAMLHPGSWIEGGTRVVLEQVIPIRCQPPHNVWVYHNVWV